MISNLLINGIDLTSGLFKLLRNIKVKKHIGSVPIEAVRYSEEKQLVKRTRIGNFELTDKGFKLLNGEICLDGI
jgi:hypothetical protein